MSGFIVDMTIFVLYGSHVTIKAIKIALEKEKIAGIKWRNYFVYLKVLAAF
jgi:hypothetical protein